MSQKYNGPMYPTAAAAQAASQAQAGSAGPSIANPNHSWSQGFDSAFNSIKTSPLFQNVSVSKPFGNSTLGSVGSTIGNEENLLGSKMGLSPQATWFATQGNAGGFGKGKTPPSSPFVPGSAVGPGTGGNGGLDLPPGTGKQTITTPNTSSTPPLQVFPSALTSLTPSNNTNTEDSLRASYLNALKPNYGMTFQGQSATPSAPMTSVPGVK